MKAKVFTSRTCGPCATYKRNLEGLSDVEFIDIDDPANIDQAIAAGVMMVPTTVFPDGTTWTGVRSREEFQGVFQGVFQV